MIPVLAIPHLNRPDLLLRCLRSIDYPVGDLVVLQNGADEDIQIADVLSLLQEISHQRFHHIRQPNMGCSGSWNQTMLMLPTAPYWMFAGNDIQFDPGTLGKMDCVARQHHFDYAAFFANQGHSLFIQTKRGTDNVGLYDWNLHPAYNEDCDWMWRLHLAGEKYMDVEGATAVHGTPEMPGSCTIHSNSRMREECHRTHTANNGYYIRKWGGIPGCEIFRNPFNNENYPPNILTYEPRQRSQNTWKL